MNLKKKIDQFNDYLADRLSYVLSIMVTFYIISLLVIIPLFYGAPTTLVTWAQYLCSVVFQGIALPVLGYTARKASDKTDKLMNEMYKMTKEIDRLVKHIDSQEDRIEEDVEKILQLEQDENNK
jgi:hypothetical protein